MTMNLKQLEKYLKADRLSVEEDIDAKDILTQVERAINDKEVYVVEPDDVDEEVKMIWTKAQLESLREIAVVSIANDMGIDASVQDKKADTIQKILEAQG